MSSSVVLTSVRRLRCLLAAKDRQDESDEQLLHAFTSRRDDSAFAVLVRRYGPLVLHVCRRVLGHEQDAEDAFQAVFLVLAQRAASLRNQTSLASFLHGIAYRTAMKAQQSAARRRKHEGQSPTRSPADPSDELSWREVQELLDREIARLPEIYRSVFVLSVLENASREEAAQRLRLKPGTVASRLAEARKRLAQRLARRGVELTAVLAATAVATPSASAVPAGLMAKTIEAALATATGEGITGIVSASVIELVKSATVATMASKTKIATIMLLAANMLAGASVCAYRGLAANVLTPSQPAAPPTAKADDKPKAASPRREAAKGMEIQGCVFDPEGKPKGGAKILLLSHGAHRKVTHRNITQLGQSAADGRFTVVVPRPDKNESFSTLIAQGDGSGIDFFDLSQWRSGTPVELRMVKDRAIRGQVVNTEGKPVAGVKVTVENIGVFANHSMDQFLTDWKKSLYYSLPPSGVKWMSHSSRWREGGALSAATTDAEGRFVLPGCGDERCVRLCLSGGGIAAEELWVINRGGFDPKPYNQAIRDQIPKGGKDYVTPQLYGSDMLVVAEAEKIIRGTVKDADSGKGRANVAVYLTRRGKQQLEMPLETTTDTEGRYELHGAHKAKSYPLQVAEDASEGYMGGQIQAADTAGYQPIVADIPVKKGVIVTGKLIDKATGKAVRGIVKAFPLLNNPFVKSVTHLDSVAGLEEHASGADDDYRVVTFPGPVLLMGGAYEMLKFKPVVPDPAYPQYFEKNPVACYLADRSRFGLGGNFCKVLEIKPDGKIVEQDIVLERSPALTVQIKDADGKPLPGVWVAGSMPLNQVPALPIQCEKAECTVYQLEPGKPRLLVFFHPERKLVGALTLKGDEKAPVEVRLEQTCALKGRLLDADGKPWAGVAVDALYPQPAASAAYRAVHRAKKVVTDRNGTFTLEELIPGLEFGLLFRHNGLRLDRVAEPIDPVFELKPGECRDLGAIKLR